MHVLVRSRRGAAYASQQCKRMGCDLAYLQVVSDSDLHLLSAKAFSNRIRHFGTTRPCLPPRGLCRSRSLGVLSVGNRLVHCSPMCPTADEKPDELAGIPTQRCAASQRYGPGIKLHTAFMLRATVRPANANSGTLIVRLLPRHSPASPVTDYSVVSIFPLSTQSSPSRQNVRGGQFTLPSDCNPDIVVHEFQNGRVRPVHVLGQVVDSEAVIPAQALDAVG